MQVFIYGFFCHSSCPQLPRVPRVLLAPTAISAIIIPINLPTTPAPPGQLILIISFIIRRIARPLAFALR